MLYYLLLIQKAKFNLNNLSTKLILEYLKDLTSLKTYIIDSDSPHEVDDAISLEINKNNKKKIWVHISNPCRLFTSDSTIDLDAKKKICSIYLIDQYIPMLPKDIINEANLAQNKVSKTISASIELDDNGSIINYEIVEAIVKPKYQLTYEDVNDIFEIEPKEELDLIELRNLLMKSISFRKKKGAVNFDTPTSKLKIDKGNVILTRVDKTIAHIIVSEAMILMGYVTSLYLFNNNLVAAYRTQKINCNHNEILERYKDSDIKYILLKQYIGKSYLTTKPNTHECLGLNMYVQCTSPLRRYLDLIIQRQVYNKINNLGEINSETFTNVIDESRRKQIEINNIYKNDKLKYLSLFFIKENKTYYKIIFVKWINHKRNIALVYFPEYLLEILITLYVSIDIYSNKVYKVKYNINDNNNLEFIY